MTRSTRLGIWCVSYALVARGVSAAGQDAVDATVQAALKREALIKTARIAWTERQTYPRGAWSAIRLPGSKDEPVPSEERAFDLSHLVVIGSGKKMRYENTYLSWNPDTKEFYTSPSISTFDGRERKSLLPTSDVNRPFPQGRKYPQGRISNEQVHEEVYNYQFFPILLATRPSLELFGKFHLQPANFTFAGDGTLNARKCLLLRQKITKQQPNEVTVWVDPDRGYSVLRYLSMRQGRMIAQIDITYSPDATLGWFPVVSYCRCTPGRVSHSSTVQT